MCCIEDELKGMKVYRFLNIHLVLFRSKGLKMFLTWLRMVCNFVYDRLGIYKFTYLTGHLFYSFIPNLFNFLSLYFKVSFFLCKLILIVVCN